MESKKPLKTVKVENPIAMKDGEAILKMTPNSITKLKIDGKESVIFDKLNPKTVKDKYVKPAKDN